MNAPGMKRITIPVHADIDKIRETLREDTGMDMTYVQIINYLIHFYKKHAAEPRTQWKASK